MGEKQGDLFGGTPKKQDERGWTELDELRRRYSSLERRVMKGEYDSKDLEDLNKTSDEIIKREKEANGKWEKSFGN